MRFPTGTAKLRSGGGILAGRPHNQVPPERCPLLVECCCLHLRSCCCASLCRCTKPRWRPPVRYNIILSQNIIQARITPCLAASAQIAGTIPNHLHSSTHQLMLSQRSCMRFRQLSQPQTHLHGCTTPCQTCRSYTHWDCIALLYAAVGGASVLKALWPALSSAAPVNYLWPLLLSTLNLVACAATAAVLVWHPGFYKRHRHSLAVANRLLRAARHVTCWDATGGSPLLLQMIATRSRPAAFTALGVLEHDSTAWQSMQRHLLRPLYVMSAVAMTQVRPLSCARRCLSSRVVTGLVFDVL
jgi:hypothetical protein